jgi:hypothetical protein
VALLAVARAAARLSHLLRCRRAPLPACSRDQPPAAGPRPRRFEGLQLPPLEQLPRGEGALARDFASARELFNAALCRLKAALGHYLLDGWVSEHVAVLMDMSNLYRWAARSAGLPRACQGLKARGSGLGTTGRQRPTLAGACREPRLPGR